MPAKRPASFLLTPQYRVDALWLNGAGPEVKAEAPNGAPAPFVDLHGLEGLLRKPDPKIVLSLPEDAELIDQLHRLTGKMPKFAQFQPTTSRIHRSATRATRARESRDGERAKRAPCEPTRSRSHYGSLGSNLRPAPQACGGRERQVGAAAKHETSLGSSHLYPRVPSSSR
ncbi:hypothetical protein N9A39_05855 [Planktomarina temperata]|nr:hypothetical protein [Planktomarina temperata]